MSASYHKHGFLLLDNRIPSHLVEAARVEAYRLHEEAGGGFGDLGSFQHGDGTQWHRKHVHHFPGVKALLPYLPVRELLGDVTCGITHSKFSYKRAGEVQVWAPHQDAAYKPEPRSGVVFAVPLERMTAENGTLEVLPDSHKRGLLPHRQVPGNPEQLEIVDEHPGTFVAAMLRPGDVLALSLFTVHGSLSNKRHGLRALLFVEVEPFTKRLRDDLGGPVTLIQQVTKGSP